MITNKLGTSVKLAKRFAIALSVASLVAVPQVLADSMAGGAASSMSGGVAESDARSGATTQSSNQWGTSNSSQSSTQNTSNSGGPTETKSSSTAGGTATSGTMRTDVVKETGVKVKTSASTPRRRVVSSSATVRSRKKKAGWKTVNYNWNTGKKTVVR